MKSLCIILIHPPGLRKSTTATLLLLPTTVFKLLVQFATTQTSGESLGFVHLQKALMHIWI